MMKSGLGEKEASTSKEGNVVTLSPRAPSLGDGHSNLMLLRIGHKLRLIYGSK